MRRGDSADWLRAILMNGAIKGETWRKQMGWKCFLPWGAPAVWLTACWLLGWQADWWMCVRVGTAGDKACSSLLSIRASDLRNNFLVVAHKSKLLTAVSSPIFCLWQRLYGRNFGVMTVQLQAIQKGRGGCWRRAVLIAIPYHTSLHGPLGIGTAAFIT